MLQYLLRDIHMFSSTSTASKITSTVNKGIMLNCTGMVCMPIRDGGSIDKVCGQAEQVCVVSSLRASPLWQLLWGSCLSLIIRALLKPQLHAKSSSDTGGHHRT